MPYSNAIFVAFLVAINFLFLVISVRATAADQSLHHQQNSRPNALHEDKESAHSISNNHSYETVEEIKHYL
jgi:hypothetical protein